MSTLVSKVMLLFASICVAIPALAQQVHVEPRRKAEIAGMEIGERQTRDEGATNIEAIRRISNRIQNRVQNRIRNRIDRNNVLQANATSPFEQAAEQKDLASRRLERR